MADRTTDLHGRPLRDLRISVIDRCNLRCTYCMPKEIFGADYAFLPRSDWLSFDQIEQLARAFVQLGVRKLRLTGGEPLLRPGLPELVRRLAALEGPDDLAITTNGVCLAPLAEELHDAGLRRATISLDALDPEILGRMNGVGSPPDRVLSGIDAAIACGLAPKINMVVQRGTNEGEILPMARYFSERGVPLRFIEYMDVGNGQKWDRRLVVPSADVLATLRREFDLEPIAPNAPGEVARRFGTPDGSWEVGLISSITAPFCGGCNRARLSADGKLFTCLFAERGSDLKPLLAEAEDESAVIRGLAELWSGRGDRYSEERRAEPAAASEAAPERVAMSFIGG